MTQEISIARFNPQTMVARLKSGSPTTSVFVGKRGTGKSTLVSDIMYWHHKAVSMGVVMSGTEEGNGFYGKYIPDIFIHTEYKSELVDGVIKRQKKALREKIKNPEVFILIDDLMYDKKMIRDKNMRLIFMNGRHWKILFMLTMQYCMDLPPDLRANIDYVFVLRENIIQNQQKIYKNFFGIFPTFQIFQETMNRCTENFDCLVLDNTCRSNKIQDCVFWYKAKPDRKYIIGDKSLWNYHKKHYRNNYDVPEPEIKGKKSTGIIIRKGEAKKSSKDKTNGRSTGRVVRKKPSGSSSGK